MDGSSLSLSVVGKEQTRESSTLSSSVAGKEQARPGSCLALYERVRNRSSGQDLLQSLHLMEEDIAKHADDEDDSWADALKFNHVMSTTVGERTMENRAFRARCREDNPLISSEELKALQKKENIRTMLEWRRGVLQGEKDFLLSAELDERVKEDELLVRGSAQDALLKEHSLAHKG